MQLEKKIDYNKKKKTSSQTIWNYMRRNPNFRLADIMIICDVKGEYFQRFIRTLEKAEYIKFVGKYKKPYSSKEYRLIKQTGVLAPFMYQNNLYDYNIKDENNPHCFIHGSTGHIPKILKTLLEAINQEEMTKQELFNSAGFSANRVEVWWKRLEKFGVILGSVKNKNKSWKNKNKYETRNSIRLYAFDLNRTKVVIKKLKHGAYTRGTPEMEHLWLKQ